MTHSTMNSYRDSSRTLSDSVAAVLVALEREVVGREAIRNHLGRIGLHPSSENLRTAIRHLEQHGWVRRNNNQIHLLNLPALRTWLNRDAPLPDDWVQSLAQIHANCLAQRARLESHNRGVFCDGAPRRGISDLVAVALIALNLDVVRRSTIRALCPDKPLLRADGTQPKTRISAQINRACRRFETKGWASRDGAFIHVRDRSGLRTWVAQGIDISDAHAAGLLAVEEAARQINGDLDEGMAVSGWDAETARRHAEVRRQEVIALQRLMQAAPGATARRGVRIIPRGRAL